MEQCPVCHNFMKFNMDYFCGSPYVYYTCDCGYDSRNNSTTTVWTSNTIEDFKVKENNEYGKE